jgi:hypothetical protein
VDSAVQQVLTPRASHTWRAISTDQGALARTLVDYLVLPLSDSAWRWCLAGAVFCALFEVLGPHAAACDWDRVYTSTVAAPWHISPADCQRAHQTLSLDLDRFNDDPDSCTARSLSWSTAG